MAEPVRVRHVRLWLVVAVLVSAAASGGGVYAYEQYATHLSVTGTNWELFLNNSSEGYVYENPTCPGPCPANAQVNSVWNYPLTIYAGSYHSNLSIVNLTLALPFKIVGVSPSVPTPLGLGDGVVILHFAIQLPSDPGTFSFTGTVWIAR